MAAIPSAGVRESNSMSDDNRIAPSPGPFMNRVKTLSALHRLLRELGERDLGRPRVRQRYITANNRRPLPCR